MIIIITLWCAYNYKLTIDIRYNKSVGKQFYRGLQSSDLLKQYQFLSMYNIRYCETFLIPTIILARMSVVLDCQGNFIQEQKIACRDSKDG